MPDATGLELIAQELREAEPDAVLETTFFRDKGRIAVAPTSILAVLQFLKSKGFTFLAARRGPRP